MKILGFKKATELDKQNQTMQAALLVITITKQQMNRYLI